MPARKEKATGKRELVDTGRSKQYVRRHAVRVRDAEGRSLGGLSSIVEKGGSGTVPVRAVALDDVIPRESTISVLHLDVEGFETPALEGALETIRRCRPVLVLKSVPDGAWLDEHLHPLDYRPESRIDTNTVLIAKLPAAL